MRDRSATSGLDKIAGLNYLSDVGLRGALPIYIVGDDPENAWRRFIYALPAVDRVDMLFFPIPGAGGRGTPSWYPSWRRLREAPRLYMDSNDFTQKGVNFDKSRNEYWVNLPRVRCCIKGFAELSNSNEGDNDSEEDYGDSDEDSGEGSEDQDNEDSDNDSCIVAGVLVLLGKREN